MMNRLYLTFSALFAAALFAGCTTTPETAPVPYAGHFSFTGNYVKLADVAVKPSPIIQQAPVYPAQWSRLGGSGEAVIDFLIDETGTTTQVQCARATDEAFAVAAMDAVKQWRFTPARKNGRIVACAVEQTIQFSVASD